MALSWKSYLANEIICWSVGCTNHLSSYILQEISGVKQEPKEENKIKFDPDFNQIDGEPSQDFDQRHQTEWTIKREPEEENEIKFDPELNQEPSQDFDQRHQEKELTVKQDQGNSFGKSSLNEVTVIFFLKSCFIYIHVLYKGRLMANGLSP